MLLRASKNTTITVFFGFFGVSIFGGFDFWGSSMAHQFCSCALRACVFLCVWIYGSKIRLKKRHVPAWAAIFEPYLSISLGVFSSRGEPAS